MLSYLSLTVLTVVGTVNLAIALFYLKNSIAIIDDGGLPPFLIVCLPLGVLALLSTGSFILNSPLTTQEISSVVRDCPAIKEKIEARSEILKMREATALYSQCIKEQKTSKAITLEMQKKAAAND